MQFFPLYAKEKTECNAQYINTISTDQDLMCSIQFQSLLIFLHIPDAIF